MATTPNTKQELEDYELPYPLGALSLDTRKEISQLVKSEVNKMLDEAKTYAINGEYDIADDDAEQGLVIPVAVIEQLRRSGHERQRMWTMW